MNFQGFYLRVGAGVHITVAAQEVLRLHEAMGDVVCGFVFNDKVVAVKRGDTLEKVLDRYWAKPSK